MNSGYTRRGGATYSPNVERPSKPRQITWRLIFCVVLVVLVPVLALLFGAKGFWGALLAIVLPAGTLAYIWRNVLFTPRGRLVLNALAMIEMLIMFRGLFIGPPVTLPTVLPEAHTPVSVTPAPEGEARTALDNMDQPLYEQQLAQVEAQGGSAVDLMTQEERQARIDAANETIYNTTVYSVYNNAKLYHAQRVCGNQTNGRELTVREAIMAGLGACPDCNPPVPVSTVPE